VRVRVKKARIDVKLIKGTRGRDVEKKMKRMIEDEVKVEIEKRREERRGRRGDKRRRRETRRGKKKKKKRRGKKMKTKMEQRRKKDVER
jgi:hypothetical protein